MRCWSGVILAFRDGGRGCTRLLQPGIVSRYSHSHWPCSGDRRAAEIDTRFRHGACNRRGGKKVIGARTSHRRINPRGRRRERTTQLWVQGFSSRMPGPSLEWHTWRSCSHVFPERPVDAHSGIRFDLHSIMYSTQRSATIRRWVLPDSRNLILPRI
jgi:hypothetical protein